MRVNIMSPAVLETRKFIWACAGKGLQMGKLRHRCRTGARASYPWMPPFYLGNRLTGLTPWKDLGRDGESRILRFISVRPGLGCVTLVRWLNLSGGLRPHALKEYFLLCNEEFTRGCSLCRF